MHKTYVASSRKNNTLVYLRVFKFEKGSYEETCMRRENDTINKIGENCPNVIKVLDRFIDNEKSLYFLAYEYFCNNLQDELMNNGQQKKLSETKAISYATQILSGIYSLHRHNIIHRQ